MRTSRKRAHRHSVVSVILSLFSSGYGQTECGAGLSVTLPGDYSGGNVGSPLPCCFVKLVDVPEKNYFAKENQGEVCLKVKTVSPLSLYIHSYVYIHSLA